MEIKHLQFSKKTITAHLIDPQGRSCERPIELRTHPFSGRTCRITFSRSEERERGPQELPPAPPDAEATQSCPFCPGQLEARTPRLIPALAPQGRLKLGSTVLFPNLFPYGAYSAVSIFDTRHYVEIGKASAQSYTDCFRNCAHYLQKVLAHDPQAVYMAITQNFLPAAGGSLVHPHLQVHADRTASNHHRFLIRRADDYYQQNQRLLMSDYLQAERDRAERYIGAVGAWHWLAAFAPEGFFEIWGVLPGVVSLFDVDARMWSDLARGVLAGQRLYRSLNRNSYNLGLISVEEPGHHLELRCVMVLRSNYAAWVRSDHTGYEVMLGDMATFSAPERTAELARPLWQDLT